MIRRRALKFRLHAMPLTTSAARLAIVFVAAAAIQVLSMGLNAPDLAHAACSGSTQARTYGSQGSGLAAYGIDGYIQYAPGTITEPECRKIANYLAVYPLPNTGTAQIQTGVRIGVKAINASWDSTYQVYAESVNACMGYSRIVYGSPTATNSAYYINYTGSQSGVCSPVQYEYAVRRDDWANAPFTYRYLPSASPGWEVSSESGTFYSPPGTFPWLGTVSFGNPSNDLGYGLAWYNISGGTWNEWTSSSTSNAGTQRTYCSQVTYRAFQVKNSAC